MDDYDETYGDGPQEPPREVEVETPPESHLRPNSYALTILMAMNRMGKHIYEGTVSDKVIAKRRAKNKAARRQRRANR